jgi:anthranilate phosphoribosyltransferase
MGKSFVAETQAAGSFHTEIDPLSLGIAPASHSDLLGGSLEENTNILESILANRDFGPRRDIVAINAAAALVVSGLAADLKEGLDRAHEALSSGAAAAKLAALRKIST